MAKQASYDMERLYQALGDRTRLRLLNLMGEQELCVCYFVEVLAQPQPKISRNLAYLRKAGIVTVRRQGTWMHYRIMTPRHKGAANILRETLAWMKEDPSLRPIAQGSRKPAAFQRITLSSMELLSQQWFQAFFR
jgi:ArsR family transcriptional regulator